MRQTVETNALSADQTKSIVSVHRPRATECDSKSRLIRVLNHIEVDRPVVDFGATLVTGVSASTLSSLKKVIFGETASPVKVCEPFQMLGMIDEQLQAVLDTDVFGVISKTTLFGFENQNWKPFVLQDGNQVLVPEKFQVTRTPEGGVGDLSPRRQVRTADRLHA